MKEPYLIMKNMGLMVLGVLLSILPQAQAITIGFETTEGYTTTGGTYAVGGLKGQPSGTGVTTWSGTGTNTSSETFRVVADTVTGSGQMLQTTANAANPFYTFAASNADLGGTFNSSTSILNFSIQFALNAAAPGGSATLARISFGASGSTGTAMFTLQVISDGTIRFNNGATSGYYATKIATDAVTTGYVAGTTYVDTTPNAWQTISGTIDYASQTYSFSLNGVQQTVGGSANLAFTPGATINDNFNLRELGGTDPKYVSTSYDNINLSLVPEPSTVSLLGISLMGFLYLTRGLRRKNALA